MPISVVGYSVGKEDAMDIKNEGLRALTVPEEQSEISIVGTKSFDIGSMKKGERITLANGVTLERSFDQKTYDQNLKVTGAIQFVRVVGPADHKSLNSDLSIEGLKEWNIL